MSHCVQMIRTEVFGSSITHFCLFLWLSKPIHEFNCCRKREGALKLKPSNADIKTVIIIWYKNVHIFRIRVQLEMTLHFFFNLFQDCRRGRLTDNFGAPFLRSHQHEEEHQWLLRTTELGETAALTASADPTPTPQQPDGPDTNQSAVGTTGGR